MLAFIDESGDTGFMSNSSDYLIFGMVIFKDKKSANFVDEKISEFRKSYGRSELKFRSCSLYNRDKFFDILLPREFDIRAVVISKESFDDIFTEHFYDTDQNGQPNFTKPQFIYNFGLQLLLESYSFRAVEIILDKQSDEYLINFMAEQKSRFNESNPGMIKEYGMRDSKDSNLIQLADMVVGAIARSYYPERSNHDRWIRQLNLKESKLTNLKEGDIIEF